MWSVLGLTGPFGSGCSTLARVLEKEFSFRVTRLSDYIKAVAVRAQVLDGSKVGMSQEAVDGIIGEIAGIVKELGKEFNPKQFEDCGCDDVRRTLQNVGNKGRKVYGRGFWARLCWERVRREARDGNVPVVIDGIRNVGEVEALRGFTRRFYLVAVTAGYEERWERVKDEFGGNQQKFDEIEQRDREETDNAGLPVAHGQQVEACVDMADVVIRNPNVEEASIDTALRKKIEQYIEPLLDPGIRGPFEDEFFMTMAYVASTRSECLKRRVGACIVADKTDSVFVGWNHAPDEECVRKYRQCYRDYLKKKVKKCPVCGRDIFECQDKGHRAFIRLLDRCRAIHAEQSALLQATKSGVSVSGGVLYCTTMPCLTCAKLLIEAGIKRVIYVEPYPDKDSFKLLRDTFGAENVVEFEGIKAPAFMQVFRRAVREG
ncbi:MAG: hypothetical protein DRP63_02505 [Planctomycetota bacterium]|nr:MAG: hypothetical protein DRP63_02505 [Planctomycetota bacterium]